MKLKFKDGSTLDIGDDNHIGNPIEEELKDRLKDLVPTESLNSAMIWGLQRIAALEAQNAELLAVLKDIEAHHVEINARAGRDEARSETLRIVRVAIKNAKGGE